MSSFVGMRSAVSELDVSRNNNNNNNAIGGRLLRKKSNSSLRNISMFSRNDKPIDDLTRPVGNSPDTEWESRHRLLTKKNGSLRSVEIPQSPDYRTLLMMKRPMSKVSRQYSDYDSCDSVDSDEDYGDEFLHHDDITLASRASNASSNSSHTTELSSTLPMFDDDDVQSELGKCPLESEEDNRSLLKISVTEQKLTKCVRLDVDETVWTAKQRIIQTLAKKLSDALNYGLYCKKLGRFLLDHKPLRDYLERGSVASYELRYKRRVFHQIMRSPKESRQLLKMQSAPKRKELMTYVRLRHVDKIHSMIRKGVDPNFHSSSGEDTPLTLAATGDNHNDVTKDLSCSPVIMALVGGGAHLDFRNRRGFTPIHVAARSSNLTALKTLLDLGASPDVTDARDLTPVYHCALIGSHVDCLRTLLQNGATTNSADSQGWTVLHQICRYGRLSHLDVILTTFEPGPDMLNCRNATGNTPIHVGAIYNQDGCVRTLLRLGADASLRNFANQDAYEVAVLAGNANIAQLIKDFQQNTDEQTLKSSTSLSSLKNGSLPPPPALPNHVEVTSSTQPRPSTLQLSQSERYDSNLPPNATLPSRDVRSTNQTLRSPSLDTRRKVALTVVRPITDPHDSDLTPPAEPPVDDVTPDDSYELLFIACKEHRARQADEISLTVGDLVTVSSQRKGLDVPEGFCLGQVGTDLGLFPLDCVQAVKLRRPKQHVKELPSKTSNHSEVEDSKSSTETTDGGLLSTNNMISTSQSDVFHQRFDVVLKKGSGGYGFVLRGAKLENPTEKFGPSAKHPALQYLESVEVKSNAHKVGLRAGHYVLKINDKDVSCFGHRQIVDTIRAAGDPLHMTVVNVIVKEDNKIEQVAKNDDAQSVTSCSTTSSDAIVTSPKGHHGRTPSIGSAIGKLDSVLAMEDVSDEAEDIRNTASLRRRPVSRRIRTQELQEIFLRQDVRNASNVPAPVSAPVSAPNPRETQSLSAATSRRLIRVLPPKLPAGGVVTEELPHATSPTSPTNSHPHHYPNPHSKPPLPNSFGHSKMYSDGMIDPVTSQPRTIGPSMMNRHTSSPALPMTSRKPPPAPPQRRNSRLSKDHPRDTTPGTSFARTPSPTQPQPPNTIAPQTAGPVRSVPSIKQSLRPNNNAHSFALAAAAAAAHSRKHSSGEAPNPAGEPPKVTSPTTPKVVPPPTAPKITPSPTAPKVGPPTAPKGPSTAPKPKADNKPVTSSSDALALALAAKRASLKQAPGGGNEQTQNNTRVIRPSSFNSALKSSNDEPNNQRTGKSPVNLPPPPPSPPNDSFILPPPPSFDSRPNGVIPDDVMNLPPPPDALLASPPPPPPPPSFAESSKPSSAPSPGLPPPNRFKDALPPPLENGVDSSSNADSGVDDVGPKQHDQNKIETLSVVSTISSEDGSDAGVSLCFETSENDRRATKSRDEKPTPAVSRVQFGGLPSPAVHPKPTAAQPVVAPAPAPAPTATKAGFETKSVTSWNVVDVGDWLRHLGLGQYVDGFAENEIDGSHLPELGKEELAEMGISRLGHRLTFERALKKANK